MVLTTQAVRHAKGYQFSLISLANVFSISVLEESFGWLGQFVFMQDGLQYTCSSLPQGYLKDPVNHCNSVRRDLDLIESKSTIIYSIHDIMWIFKSEDKVKTKVHMFSSHMTTQDV